MEMNEINSSNEAKKATVTVRNAYKRYGTNIILNGLNMTIKEGTIYGLLGPSGCGKTTLLNCILGKHRLDSGVIKVNTQRNADIGYMPQGYALYRSLSIEEVMTYFGRVFGLDDIEIKSRSKYLSGFLELPSKFLITDDLSGGQKRRVSFAVALIHNPKFVILDEPTAGVDPVLCVSIWDKLLQMVETANKTVIVTTHYIEETRRAHTVGLMRNGKLLAEDSPSELLVRFNSSTLEEVFLRMIQEQSANLGDRNYDYLSIAAYPSPKDKPEMPLQQSYKLSKKIIFAQLTKNLYFIKRNPLIVIIVLLLPIVNSWLYCACIGNDPTKLKLAVVNEELFNISSCESLPSRGCNFSIPLSCRFLKKMRQKTYDLTEYHDIDEAVYAVKENRVWGLIHFQKNYTASTNEKITSLRKVDAMNDIQIWSDMSNRHIGSLIKKDAIEEYEEYFKELFADCGWPPRTAVNTPIRMEKAVYGNKNVTFRHTISAAVISSFQFYLPLTFTMEFVLMEKKTGSLERSLISGVTILEISIAIAIIQFFVLAGQSTSMMLMMFVLYDNPLVGNLLWIISLLSAVGVSGMVYGFLIGVISNSEQTAIFASIGTTYAIFLLCGAIWPMEGMHWLLRSICSTFPVTQCAEAFFAVSMKKRSISNATVYEGIIWNFAWSCAFILIIVIFVMKNKGL